MQKYVGGFGHILGPQYRGDPLIPLFGLRLLDRSRYRVRPTEVRQSFHRRAQALLRELEGLHSHTEQLAMGEESELCVVIGDLCPRPQMLGMLSHFFFAACPGTRLHLHFEAVTGPWERLFDGDAELILHRVDKSDPRLEWVDLSSVAFIIRDTARHSPSPNYFIIDGAPQCTVADHSMKKEIILQGLGWGHLPRFLIEEELRDGRLQSIAGRYLPGRTEELVAARRRDRPHGPVANRLWSQIRAQAPKLRRALKPSPATPPAKKTAAGARSSGR